MSADRTSDCRRHGVIETRYKQHGKLAMYNLTINGKLWACVEWSASRRGWCIQDAAAAAWPIATPSTARTSTRRRRSSWLRQ